MNLHLSRQDHDALADIDQALLLHLFNSFPRSWQLSGVTFFGVDDVTVGRLREQGFVA